MEKEWIDVTDAAKVLGYGEEPTESAKIVARNLLNHFNVDSQVEPKPEGEFGKGKKLYNAAQVQKIATFKL